MSETLTAGSIKERNAIIVEHRELILAMRTIEKEIATLIKNNDIKWRDLEEKRGAMYHGIEPIVKKYWEWIPSVQLSRCPICKSDLYRRFDPVDCHGFWWMDRTQRPVEEPEHCGHFRLLLGALNTNGKAFDKTLFEIHPGPEKPFVIPRILDLPTMQAVISEISMHCGYSAHPICYFSEQAPGFKALTQSWARKEYHFKTEDGKTGWDVIQDTYDFDLEPWEKLNKVKRFALTQ